MLRAFEYRLYPNKEQVELINKHIGSARFIYNIGLEVNNSSNENKTTPFDCYYLIKQIPGLKKDVEWLKEINSQTLQAPIKNLDNAFKRFRRKTSGYPKFKSKWSGKQSFHIPQNIYFDDGKLSIPKFGEGIKIELHRAIKGDIRFATISRRPTGKYYVSIVYDTGVGRKPKPPIKAETTIGIDLGIKDFMVSPKRDKVNNPRYLKNNESKLKYTQRKYSKNKGKRTKKELSKIHEKTAFQRKDFLHKESSRLVKENQSIAIEDLDIKGMMKDRKLAKAISDVGWGMFTTMLEYKCDWYGVNLLKIGRYDPSSKTCSSCGDINHELTLKDREWSCKECNAQHDRDINAAINIKNFALIKNNTVSGTATENHDELSSLEEVLTLET
jgi:putative transposase